MVFHAFLFLLIISVDQDQKVPDLELEEPSRVWSSGTRTVHSASSGLVQRVKGVISLVSDYAGDPRIGPSLLLCACISFGAIWLKNTSPSVQSSDNRQVIYYFKGLCSYNCIIHISLFVACCK